MNTISITLSNEHYLTRKLILLAIPKKNNRHRKLDKKVGPNWQAVIVRDDDEKKSIDNFCIISV